MRQPGDGIGLPAAGGVLDEIPRAGTVGRDVRQNLMHHVALVVARKHLLALLPPGLGILLLHDLGIVLEDVGETARGEDFFPEIICLQAGRVGRIARAVVPPLVEGQKPRGFAAQLGTHAHLGVVHGEMDDAAPELEELFARVTVAAVLLDGVLDGLLGQAVFEFKRRERQAVDEQAQVQRPARLVLAVTQLARDAETVFGKERRRGCVARRGCAVEEIEMQGAVVHTLAQHVNDAALADFVGEAGEKLLPVDVFRVLVIGDAEFLERFRLCGVQELEQLRHFERVGAVVVLGIAGEPARAGRLGGRKGIGRLGDQALGHGRKAVRAGHVAHDQHFEAFLGDVGAHSQAPNTRPPGVPCLVWPLVKPREPP